MAKRDCPAECPCTSSSPACPPGVSLVTHKCGCCKVCAKQFNQDCSDGEPCDYIKGLHCHLGAGGDPLRGLCRAKAQGLPCEFGGHVYQHGEDFQLSCQHQCSCIDGVIGCMPLCPHQVPLPDWHCSRPRLARPQGHCCEVWVCDDDNRISEEPGEPTPASIPHAQLLPNHISTKLQTQHTQSRTQASTVVSFREAVSLPRSEVLLDAGCFPQTTNWTQCSSTCGMGISSRVTNNNPGCHLIRETRLCEVQRCDLQRPPPSKRGKRCQRTVRPRESIRITFAGCSTAQRYRPRTCGACGDGRCCTPSLSRTVRLRFHCLDGESFARDLMWIQRCSCTNSCRSRVPASGPSVSLYNDIHTFRR
ncbi:cellular communication network factor 1, like 2 isoform X2 [Lampris incognitus]|uniref:cellular communication network factor 1, like 2 isoform X2 n=1 Tax=Lampris incognitus TaxID=2546036 RepID=UPI0024B4BAFA|nr:cellular communication network factor 1, like 2 isoform X2 [Lampris incognitus]